MRAPLILLALLALPACGRVGPVRAPGPASAVTYPRVYPYFPPARPGAATTTPTPSGTGTGAGPLSPGAPPADMPVGQGDLPLDRAGIQR